MPKVSVIIPTFNRASYVCEAIDSVLAQTYQDLEIIVVDDGSTDDTLPVLETYGERLRLLRQKNSGPAVARNRGIFAARGEYIAFLDSDDLWVPSKLEKQVAVLDSEPEIGLVYTDCFKGKSLEDITNGSGGCYAEWAPQSGDIFGQLTRLNLVATPSVLVRFAVLRRVGIFDPLLRRGEDYDLWLRIAHVTKARFLPDVLCLIRQHDSRTTNDVSNVITQCVAQELQLYRFQYLRQALINSLRLATGTHYGEAAYAYRKLGDYAMAETAYWKAARYGHSRIRSVLYALFLRYCPFLFRWHDQNSSR